MSKVLLVRGNQRMEFETIEQAQAYLKENNITDVQIVDASYKPKLPPTIEEFYDNLNYTPSVGRMCPMSGQERRRERREKERKNRR